VRARRAAVIGFVNVAILLLLLVVVEGISSYLLVGKSIFENRPIAERVHTEYDEEVGWINLPNLYIADMYGPDVSLTTNSQRFRNRDEFTQKVPPDKVRLICSGDSYTLGYGVDDDHTWCRWLTVLDERLQTVNLGQGGYGVDQAYLWYQRNRNKLEHNVHIFAFITGDFTRMKTDKFLGYGKPYLIVQDEELVQVNRPIPNYSYYIPWAITNVRKLKELKTAELVSGIYKIFANGKSRAVNSKPTEAVVSKIFASLQRWNREKNSILVLVHLPVLSDYRANGATTHWSRYVQQAAKREGYHFVDIVGAFRKVPAGDFAALFAGHYSVAGNKFVADLLYEKLNEIPEIRRRLVQ